MDVLTPHEKQLLMEEGYEYTPLTPSKDEEVIENGLTPEMIYQLTKIAEQLGSSVEYLTCLNSTGKHSKKILIEYQ